MKDHQLAIGEAVEVRLDPTGANRGRGIKCNTGVLWIVTTGAAVGADLLRGNPALPTRCSPLMWTDQRISH